MYDTDKAKQLQKQSHVRGMLSKQFYSNQQTQLQKKRRQMKRILDEQVEQRRRVKQKEKLEVQKKQKKQQEQIRKYYQQVIQRERRLSDHTTNNNNNQKGSSNEESLVKKHYQQSLKNRANSKTTLQDIQAGDIPLMPVMALSDGQFTSNNHNMGANINYNTQANNHYNSSLERQNLGNIPLLDLSDESNFMKNKKKSKTHIKRQKTQRQNPLVNPGFSGSNVKYQESRNTSNQIQTVSTSNINQSQNISSLEANRKNERKKTHGDEDNISLAQQNIINSRVSKMSKYYQNTISRSPSNSKRNTENQIPQQIQQMQSQNKFLKSQLKKSQQAISLLIGAVRSNAKLDKFRVQAERILHNAQNESKVNYGKINQKREQSPLLLPKLKIKHQSIMHDYLIEAAKKARLKHIKSQAQKY